MSVRLRTARTSDLGDATLAAVGALMDSAFGGEFDDTDWEHTLGGIHALLLDDDGAVVAHGAVVPRWLHQGGRRWDVGYVEGFAVRADHRRAGHGGTMMSALEALIDTTYDFGALATTDEADPFYVDRGWVRWAGRTGVTDDGGRTRRPTPDVDGGLFVRDGRLGDEGFAELVDVTGDIDCEQRSGDDW